MTTANYAEASYFDGFHFAHIAAFEDALRLGGLKSRATADYRRRHCRVAAFWMN